MDITTQATTIMPQPSVVNNQTQVSNEVSTDDSVSPEVYTLEAVPENYSTATWNQNSYQEILPALVPILTSVLPAVLPTVIQGVSSLINRPQQQPQQRPPQQRPVQQQYQRPQVQQQIQRPVNRPPVQQQPLQQTIQQPTQQQVQQPTIQPNVSGLGTSNIPSNISTPMNTNVSPAMGASGTSNDIGGIIGQLLSVVTQPQVMQLIQRAASGNLNEGIVIPSEQVIIPFRSVLQSIHSLTGEALSNLQKENIQENFSYLIDSQGNFRCDPQNPSERAQVVSQLLTKN